MASLALRIAGGGGFNAEVGRVRYVKPHKKKRGLSLVGLLWSKKHGRKPNKDGINELVVVGEWDGIEKRWKALRRVS